MFYSNILKFLRGTAVSNVSTSLLRRNNCSYSSKIISSGSARSENPAFSSQLPLISYKLTGNVEVDHNVPNKMEHPKLQILDRPNDLLISIIDVPKISTIISYEDVLPLKEISEPEPIQKEEKHAVRMIVIRRRKMRIHKKKKWRKKMKHHIAKIEIRRKQKKEKEFQAELMAKVKEAEKFDPSAYVKNKLELANKEIIPHRWKGKRLPEFVIIHEREFANKKLQNKLAARERRKNMNTNAADYN